MCVCIYTSFVWKLCNHLILGRVRFLQYITDVRYYSAVPH